MTLEVRRIVTGHDAAGKAIVASDERMTAPRRPDAPGSRAARSGPPTGCRWTTRTRPRTKQRQGFVVRHNYVGSGQGTVVRITEFAPGSPKFMHRTETLDYAILLSGECDLELDDGKTVHLTQGDVVVQRGTIHAWVNNGTQPCVFAFVLIDANPAEAGGQSLRTHYPA